MKWLSKQSLYSSCCTFTAFSFGCVYGCTPVPVTSSGKTSQVIEVQQTSESRRADLYKIKAAHQKQLRELHTFPPAQRGAIALEIGPNTNATFSFGKVERATYKIASESSQLWSRRLSKGIETLDITENIEILNTDQRYQLSIAPVPEAPDTARLSLWVNGAQILERVRVNQTHTLSPQGLRAQNTLRLLIEGEESFEFSIALDTIGPAGTVLRRPDENSLPYISNTTTSASLDPQALIQAGLLPSIPGNKNTSIPETETAEISLNLHAPEEVATGQLYIQLAEPEAANLASILEEYSATVIQEPIENPRFYLIQPDLKKINLNRLEAQLRQLNANQSDPYLKIQRARFGNLESAKTFAFAISMISDPRIESVGFNPVLHTSDVAEPFHCTEALKYKNDINAYEGPGGICENAQSGTCINTTLFSESSNFWWLTERSTHVDHAWRYTQGYSHNLGRPIRVAVIDQGFAGLKELTQAGKDLAGRVLLDQGGTVQMNPTNPLDIQAGKVQPFTPTTLDIHDNTYKTKLGTTKPVELDIHGTQTTSTIVSNYNDGQGIVGVAPLAQVIPYFVAGSTYSPGTNQSNARWSEVVTAIQHASTRQVSAINISMNSRDMDVYLKGYFETLSKNSWIAPAQALIHRLAEQGVPIVVSAGNFGWPSIYTLPGKLYFPEIIAVGALSEKAKQNNHFWVETRYENGDTVKQCFEGAGEYSQRSSGSHQDSLVRYTDGMSPIKMKTGSNYGDTSVIDIWAPGNRMLTVGPSQPSTRSASMSPHWGWRATSAAAPMVTGTIALLKSISPNLSVEEIRRILQTTAEEWSYEDTERRSLPFLDRSLQLQNGETAEKAECGYIEEIIAGTSPPSPRRIYYNCGRILTPDENRQQRILSLRSDKAVEHIPGFAAPTHQARTLFGTIQNGQFQTTGLSFDLLQAKKQPIMYGVNLVKGSELFPNAPDYTTRYFSHFFQILPGPQIIANPQNPTFTVSTCKLGENCAILAQEWQTRRFKTIQQLVNEAQPSDAFKAEVFLNPGSPQLLSLEKLPSAQISSPKQDIDTSKLCDLEDQNRYDQCSNSANPYDPGGSIITWQFEPNSQGELCIKIDNCPQTGGPTPVPSMGPSAEPAPSLEPPGSFSAPVEISEAGRASNIRAITGSQPKSILRNGPFAKYSDNILGANATAGPSPAAQWVELIDQAQVIELTYPRVPNTVNLDNPSELHYLRILLQVKNKGKGGQVYVNADGSIRTEKFGPGTRYPDGELQPIVFDFIESAKETGGTQVQIRIENAQPGIQIIYKLFGIPKR